MEQRSRPSKSRRRGLGRCVDATTSRYQTDDAHWFLAWSPSYLLCPARARKTESLRNRSGRLSSWYNSDSINKFVVRSAVGRLWTVCQRICEERLGVELT